MNCLDFEPSRRKQIQLGVRQRALNVNRVFRRNGVKSNLATRITDTIQQLAGDPSRATDPLQR